MSAPAEVFEGSTCAYRILAPRRKLRNAESRNTDAMNNSQFRRLLVDTPRQKDGDQDKSPAAPASKTVLGARKHSSIPMTPRQVGRTSVQSEFARQLAERNAKGSTQKKARSSAPKGTKLAAGYVDRTKDRIDDEDNEIAKRIKNLEESMKLGDIDRSTFESLVLEITGGDINSTHLVKGLDRKLLERVRRGEDLAGDQDTRDVEDAQQEPEPEVEDAFDELEAEDVGPILREKTDKKGETRISPPPVAGVKRSRNDILKELKAQRERAAKAAEEEHAKKYPSLGPGFRKVNPNGETMRIETDDRGREVLIITGPDGKERRKVKKQKPETQQPPEVRHDLDDTSKPINMHDLPQPKAQDSSDDDIFEGVGSSYNPLANLSDEDDEDDGNHDEDAKDGKPEEEQLPSDTGILPPPAGKKELPPPSLSKRDYFSSSSKGTTAAQPKGMTIADATVRAALAKVRNLDENSSLLQNLSSADADDPEKAKEARLQKRAAELAASDRDLDDMDLGFGASRFDDAEEMEKEGEKVKLSQWKGIGAEHDGEDEDDAKGAKKRKRGPKKKRGDKNNVDDVLQAMERQKEKRTLG